MRMQRKIGMYVVLDEGKSSFATLDLGGKYIVSVCETRYNYIYELELLEEGDVLKLYLIRHAKVNMDWPKKCNSVEFDRACKQYDMSEIVEVNKFKKVIDYKKIYVSSLYRSLKTAQGLFPENEYIEINIGEVPLKAYKDSSVHIPLWIWNIMGRIQWYFNNKRQDETRSETINRSMLVIKELEKINENCVIVTHGFFLKTFISCLKKQGYSIRGNNKTKFSNLQLIVAEKT